MLTILIKTCHRWAVDRRSTIHPDVLGCSPTSYSRVENMNVDQNYQVLINIIKF